MIKINNFAFKSAEKFHETNDEKVAIPFPNSFK